MSGIVINIKAGDTFEKSRITATGQQVNIIADSERASFGIGSDADLKRAVGNYFGKEPTDAYLKSPTPWGDLYKIHGWPQVQRVLQPIRAQILEIKTTPTILSTNTLTNKSNKTATFTTNISEQVTDTVRNEWTNSSKVSYEHMIKYEIGFVGIGASGEAKFAYEQTWGKSKTVTKQTNASAATGVVVELKPGESVTVELSASSGKMRVRITYEAYLTGDTAINYYPRYKGHHFWALPIDGVLNGSNKVQIIEDVEVAYYCNATARVKNAKTNEDMIFYMADHPSEPSSPDYPDEPASAEYPGEHPSAGNTDEPASAEYPGEHPSADNPAAPPSE